MGQLMSTWLTRVCQFIALAAIVAVVGVLIGSLVYNTRWEGKNWFGVDGFWQWAPFTLPLGAIALLILLRIWEGLRDPRIADRFWLSGASSWSLLAAGCCAGTALIAKWCWQSLLDQPPDPDVKVRIAQGLPVVVTAGSAGCALALLLALSIWWGCGTAHSSLS